MSVELGAGTGSSGGESYFQLTRKILGPLVRWGTERGMGEGGRVIFWVLGRLYSVDIQMEASEELARALEPNLVGDGGLGVIKVVKPGKTSF